MRFRYAALYPALAAPLLFLAACGTTSMTPKETASSTSAASARKDWHSYANPDQVRMTHVDLDLDVSFEKKQLAGHATLTLERVAQGLQELALDTRDLDIQAALASADGKEFQPVPFRLDSPDKFLGSRLAVDLPATARYVRVRYATKPNASGLQWLTPQQTAGKRHPFLFSQSQAIHARSWIPLQDTPGVRVTYAARIRTPKDLLAVMSAENEPNPAKDGDYSFRMPQRIPAYLIALAVGDLTFAPTGKRSGVYAEPSVVKQAAREFEDTEPMMQAVEKLYGPYRWGRYDLLVLPPSFPFGGMENPRLTFATPTILAGDKSLVSLVAHELAHSWSGNLVTNATWRDFWLNEGFTVYLEQRTQEAVYGKARADMEAVLERRELDAEMKTLAPADQILYVDLKGRDPDDGFTQVPYIKGALLLRQLEQAFGRERFDAFLRGYFDHFAFQSITTENFVAYLRENLLQSDQQAAARIPLDEWLYKPGMPASAPVLQSDAFARVEADAQAWLQGQRTLAQLPYPRWSTQERLHFLNSLPHPLPASRMQELDKAFQLTDSRNSEILFAWLLRAIQTQYSPAMPQLDQFLSTVGRRKFIKPLYEELVKTPAGKQRAQQIYAKARSAYHPISAATVDTILR